MPSPCPHSTPHLMHLQAGSDLSFCQNAYDKRNVLWFGGSLAALDAGAQRVVCTRTSLVPQPWLQKLWAMRVPDPCPTALFSHMTEPFSPSLPSFLGVAHAGHGSLVHSQLLWAESRPLRTVYEEDLGHVLCDVNFLLPSSSTSPSPASTASNPTDASFSSSAKEAGMLQAGTSKGQHTGSSTLRQGGSLKPEDCIYICA